MYGFGLVEIGVRNGLAQMLICGSRGVFLGHLGNLGFKHFSFGYTLAHTLSVELGSTLVEVDCIC